MELGAALDHKDKKGLTALHYAAGSGRLEVVRYLWTKGAEVDAESPGGWRPLLACVMARLLVCLLAPARCVLAAEHGWVGVGVCWCAAGRGSVDRRVKGLW